MAKPTFKLKVAEKSKRQLQKDRKDKRFALSLWFKHMYAASHAEDMMTYLEDNDFKRLGINVSDFPESFKSKKAVNEFIKSYTK